MRQPIIRAISQAFFFISLATLLSGIFSDSGNASGQKLLAAIQERSYLRCGVSKGAIGYSQVDSAGKWSGLAVDFCQALSVAIFGNKEAVKFVPLAAAARFTALQNKEVDVMVHNTSWTLGLDTKRGVQFVSPLFYSGAKLLVRLDQNVESVLELAGASVCVLAGSASEQHIATFFKSHKMRYELVAFDKWGEAVEAYQAKRCQALAGNLLALSTETILMSNAAEQMLLPEYLAVDILGPVVRTDDDNWFKIVRWTVAAMIRAEELAVTSANAEYMRANGAAAIRKFLRADSEVSKALGLSAGWTYRVVSEIGNYGESFSRNFGDESKLKLDRSLNNIWGGGGLLVAPHFR